MKALGRENGWLALAAPTRRGARRAHKRAGTAPQEAIHPYERFLRARVKRLEFADWTPEIAAEMQAAFLAALNSREPMPEEMRYELFLAFREVCAGIESPLLAPVRRHGGRQHPIARDLQADAMRYLQWVRASKIADHAPVKTVADTYGMTTTRVQQWQREWKGRELPPILPVYRSANFVTALMRTSGKAYRRFIKDD